MTYVHSPKRSGVPARLAFILPIVQVASHVLRSFSQSTRGFGLQTKLGLGNFLSNGDSAYKAAETYLKYS